MNGFLQGCFIRRFDDKKSNWYRKLPTPSAPQNKGLRRNKDDMKASSRYQKNFSESKIAALFGFTKR
jgi:hypothetical protein